MSSHDLIDEFPFMRDHLEHFQPMQWAKVHECLRLAHAMAAPTKPEVGGAEESNTWPEDAA
jgi:hypothetical protein